MKCSSFERFLGDQLGSSLSESISATISKRMGRATQSIYEIKAVIDDLRANTPGGILSGLMIWEMAVIPFLLFNSGTWFSMKKSDIKRLDSLQNLFFSVLFKVQHSPVSSFLWDCKVLTMSNRILKNKLLLCHHLLSLPINAVSRIIFEEQIKIRFPGLWLEVEEFLISNEVDKLSSFSKHQWKSFVSEKIFEQNEKHVASLMKTSSKIQQSDIQNEEFEVKSYLKELIPSYARVKFRQRYFMIKEAKLNFPNDPTYKSQGFQCDFCQSISSQNHIKVCKEFENFREGKNLEEDMDLIQYFVDVIQYRQEVKDFED